MTDQKPSMQDDLREAAFNMISMSSGLLALGRQPKKDHHEISELAERLDAHAAAMDAARPVAWQPIETAPKDGRYVLAYVENTVQILFFDSTRGSSGGYWVRHPGDCLDLKPTHWRPMPAPPANLTGATNG